MTFPQPSSVDALVGGKQFFRLFTELESAGDIYESEVGALGFAMGPDSDLASVRISYYDVDGTDTGVGSIVLSPDRNFVGRVDARPADRYIHSVSRRGRILISPIDTFAPDIFATVLGAGSLYQVIRPNIDVLQYFDSMPSVSPQRSDRKSSFTSLPPASSPTTQSTSVCVPSYGRKSGALSISNRSGIDFQLTVFGVNFSLEGTTVPFGSFTSLLGVDVSTAVTRTWQFRSSQDGIWDYLILSLGPNTNGDGYNGGPIYLDITLSDDLA